MSELFQIEESLSPRLAWLRRHDLTTRKLPSGRWECVFDEENIGSGATEDESTIDFCLKTQLPHFRTP